MDVDLRTTKLGHTFRYTELLNHCRAIWGAVAWPAKLAGFAVVIGMGHEPHFDSHDIYLLEEFESYDMRQLIRQCGVLDLKYSISLSRSYRPGESGQWIGDYENDAASRFIQEMNDETTSRHFGLNSTPMLEMERPYQYMLPQIKELLESERRQLYLKNSKITNYLSEIEENEIAELEFGEYSSIEALAFAVIEMRNYIRSQEQFAHLPKHDPWDDNILLRGMKCDPYAHRVSDFGRRSHS